MNDYIRHVLIFIGLFLLQTLIVSNLQLSYYINPYVHLLFVLTLPRNVPFAWLLVLAFISGLILDILLSSAGLHAAASVWMAFLRPFLLNLLTPKGSLDATMTPNIHSPGLIWFITYLGLHAIIYLSFYFLLEVFSFQNFHHTLLKIVLSTIVSVGFMTLLAFLFSAGRRRK